MSSPVDAAVILRRAEGHHTQQSVHQVDPIVSRVTERAGVVTPVKRDTLK